MAALGYYIADAGIGMVLAMLVDMHCVVFYTTWLIRFCDIIYYSVPKSQYGYHVNRTVFR